MSTDQSPGLYTPEDYADLRNALAALSALVASPPDDDLFSDPLAHPTLQSAWRHLCRVLQRHPSLPLHVLPNGQITAFQQPILSPDPSSQRRIHLGTLLASHGIERLSFSAQLEPSDLALFISILHFHTSRQADGEHDLVTHWFDLQNANIVFEVTAPPPSLSTSPPADDAAAHTFHLAHALCLTAYNPQNPLIAVAPPSFTLRPATSATALGFSARPATSSATPIGLTPRPATTARPATSARLATPTALPQGYNPATAWQPLDAHKRVVLDMLLQPLLNETDTSARKQLLNALLAATSAREPALSPQDFSFLFNKLFQEFITATEFEDAFQLIRNLEHFLERTAKVQSTTRDVALTSLTRLRSPRNLLHLIRRLSSSEQFVVPRPITRWLLSQDPLPLWSQVVTQTSQGDIPSLVATFQVAFPPHDPFWTAALTAIPPSHASIAQEVISQFGHTEALSPSQSQHTSSSDHPLSSSILHTHSRPPSKIIVRSEAPAQPTAASSDQGWDDFDFDNLPPDPDDIQLDDDMAAFLDGSNTTPKDPPPTKRRVASDMLRDLEAIQRDLPDDSNPPK